VVLLTLQFFQRATNGDIIVIIIIIIIIIKSYTKYIKKEKAHNNIQSKFSYDNTRAGQTKLQSSASSTTSIVSASVSVDLTEGVSDIAGVDSEGHLLANALANALAVTIQQISPLPISKLVRQRKHKTEGAEVY